MKIWLVATFAFCCILLMQIGTASAQVGFNPEYLGNANAPSRTGFALKTFQSYYYQNSITASDVETDFETQYYTKAFTGDIKKDMFQWALHLPVGYRYQKDANNVGRSVTGIGNLNAIIEYYYNIIDDGETKFWFDNGLVVGFPTATQNNGVQLGGDNYSITWFQENFVYHKPFMLTINPISVTWSFRDDNTNQMAGLGLSLMSGSAGYEINEKVYLGIDFGLTLGNIIGSDDGNGNSLPRSLRAYTGPAALIAFNSDTSLQICTVVDFVTRQVSRGQGIFLVLWHHF
ncbi:MAG: hypothetical protein HN337_01530 [Deltaproteobacteria bacterium]|nr:hypothetical protein [Deltaproteobacteria bacterium]